MFFVLSPSQNFADAQFCQPPRQRGPRVASPLEPLYRHAQTTCEVVLFLRMGYKKDIFALFGDGFVPLPYFFTIHYYLLLPKLPKLFSEK